MLVNPIQSFSNNQCKKQNPAFGSFTVPKNYAEAMELRNKATLKKILPTADNIDSLKKAYAQSKDTIKFYMEDLAHNWGLKTEDLLK